MIKPTDRQIEAAAFSVGDIMNWQHRVGSYGFLQVTPVEVVKVGHKRVTVKVALIGGGFRNVSVKPENLTFPHRTDRT